VIIIVEEIFCNLILSSNLEYLDNWNMNKVEIKNIFENIPENIREEVFESFIDNKNFRLERIISEGHTSPPNFWYNQENDEFVLLLSGSAELHFENGEKFVLKRGDYLIIPAHKKHRVEWTDENQKTIWLALHY
jgi:cupin 2 domain-containing protein